MHDLAKMHKILEISILLLRLTRTVIDTLVSTEGLNQVNINFRQPSLYVSIFVSVVS